ncbi:MAG: hypothetical protein ACREK8_02285, partial [Gemmatimonadales bacterium]
MTAMRPMSPSGLAGILTRVVVAALLGTPVQHVSGQAPGRADRCQANESWQACYDRATQVVLGEIKA